MKRSLFITIVVLLMAALFVSCNSDKAVEDQLFEVTIDGGARGLSATGTVSIDVDNLYWYYTATKTSGLFRTGETDGLTPVKTSENLPAKGLSAANLGTFSKGGWNFCFYGYAEADPTTAPVFLQEDLAQTVSGTTTLQLTLERGAAVLDASVSFAGITWKIPATESNLIGTLTLEVSSTGMDTVEYGADPWNATTGIASFTGSYALPGTGDKTLTFSVFNTYTTANGTTLKEKVGEEQITLKVISGIQYTVVNTGDGISLFEDDNPQPVTIGTITVPQSEIKGFTAESTGAAVVNAAGAKVTFPESALTTTTEHTLAVSTTPRATAEENFVIEGSTAVAAIDVKLDNAATTEFTTGLVEIETTIETGLANVSVQYKNGTTYSSTFMYNNTETPYLKSYDAGTGKLVIQTNHFSEYVAVIDCVAKIGDKAYGSVAAAIAAVPKTGIETVVTLMKNYEETASIAVNGNRNVVLDLNGKTLGLTQFTYIYNGELTIKNGTLNTGSNLWIDGQKTAASGMKSALTVASDAKLVGDYCIILENYSTTDPAYDATIDVYGKLDGMIWVMGNIVEGNCVINIHDGAVINSAEVGIALNGMATLNVEEGASITGVETAIEVRSGILNITGGTFKSTGTAFTCDPNGNGTTTKGAAIAIAQHTTKKDIKVTISGGTFEGIRALNESNPQENDPAPQVDLTISGGTFKSTAETDPIAISITDYANTTVTEGIIVTNGAVLPAPVALAGGVYYISLADAIAAAPSGATVRLLKNAEGAGIFLAEADAKTVTIDLAGFTFTCTGPAVGSTGTQTQALHLEKGNTVTLKNGTVEATATSGVLMLVQNYCNLTLEDVVLDGTILGSGRYTLSNNFGSALIKGDTDIIAAEGGYAFDLWYGMSPVYYDGVAVTFADDWTGEVTGKIEYGAKAAYGATQENWQAKTVLTINGSGTFTPGVITKGSSSNPSLEDANIIVGANYSIEKAETSVSITKL